MRAPSQLEEPIATVQSAEVWGRIFANGGRSAFRSGPLILRETVYGIAKRLRIFVDSIEGYRHASRLRVDQIRILDVGCGTGVNVTVPLAGAGYQVVGLEMDFPSVAQGKLLSKDGPQPHFVVGSIEHLPLDIQFDVVICSEVLEHLEDIPAVLDVLGRVLRPGGLLLITLPNPYGFFELDSVLWRWLNERPGLIERVYSWESRLFERYGSERLRRRRAIEYQPDRLPLTWSTLASDQGHAHALTPTALTRDRLARHLERSGWRVVRQGNTTFLAGNLVGLLVRELDWLLALNGWLADVLPWPLVADWIVVAERGEPA